MDTEPKIHTNDRPVVKKDFEGKVEFQKVFFRYGDRAALRHISFTAYPGQTVAIIGPTGAGKSTLVNLICRFYDVTGGAVKIDGVDVRDIEIRRLRETVSMAQQDIFLFSDTIEGNIAYGVPSAAFADVERVAKLAGADGFIRALPEGYDTIVGERGVGLSGGQKQRIALARALLKNPSVLVLDDTTSSVDMETEREIHRTLRRQYQNKTTFIIAHRISSVKNASLILVLEDGEIAERGTHEELVALGGKYYHVFENQYGDFDRESLAIGGVR
jgi:ATP-binding cassette subfamily B protein